MNDFVLSPSSFIAESSSESEIVRLIELGLASNSALADRVCSMMRAELLRRIPTDDMRNGRVTVDVIHGRDFKDYEYVRVRIVFRREPDGLVVFTVVSDCPVDGNLPSVMVFDIDPSGSKADVRVTEWAGSARRTALLGARDMESVYVRKKNKFWNGRKKGS